MIVNKAVVFLPFLLFIPLHQVVGFDLNLLTSALNNKVLSSIVSTYLGGNTEILGVINRLTEALSSNNQSVLVDGINKAMSYLSSEKIVTGYANSTTPGVITLGILNTDALNSSVGGKLTTSLLNNVISKLNQTSVISGLTAVSGGYNLGSLNVTSLMTKFQQFENKTIASLGDLTNVTLPPMNYTVDVNKTLAIKNSSGSVVLELKIPEPLVPVHVENTGLTFEEKLQLYEKWYADTITKMRQMNITTSDPAAVRAVMFCYPGPNPLPYSSLSSTPTIISCEELNKTFHDMKEHSDDLLNVMNSPQSVISFLRNSSEVRKTIEEIKSQLTQLSTIVSGSDSTHEVNNRIQLFGELLNAVPQTLNPDSLSSFKDFAEKYFQWSQTDFSTLLANLF